MEQKTYIGLTPTKEIQEKLSKLRKHADVIIDNFLLFYYLDDNGIKQIREECWLILIEAGEELFKAPTFIRAVENGIPEGEMIFFDWQDANYQYYQQPVDK